MKILAFESSCDDTSVALLEAESNDELPKLLSFSVQSQNEVHEKWGGVVPELASRAHLQNILPCLTKTLKEADCELSDIDLFAATNEPGLIGCLMVGHTAAKTLAMIYDKPFVGCHHIEGHLMSALIEHRPHFPLLSLVVSGGHSSLYLVKSLDEFELLGGTLDDAVGEAFDKGAKLLGLGFPGGAMIDALSKSGNAERYSLGRVQTSDLQFSFSGLKSEFVRLLQREKENLNRADAAASYQKALLDHLFQKIELALKRYNLKRLSIVGGVASNSELRRRLEQWKAQNKIEEWFAPSLKFCTDNAAMIGMLAYRKYKRGELSSLTEDVRSTSRPSARKKRLAS